MFTQNYIQTIHQPIRNKKQIHGYLVSLMSNHYLHTESFSPPRCSWYRRYFCAMLWRDSDVWNIRWCHVLCEPLQDIVDICIQHKLYRRGRWDLFHVSYILLCSHMHHLSKRNQCMNLKPFHSSTKILNCLVGWLLQSKISTKV